MRGSKDLLSLLLVVSGSALVVFTYFGGRDRPSGPPQGRAVSVEVDAVTLQESLPASANGETSPILAVFLLHAKVCPPCLAELNEYASLLAAQRGPSIDRLAVVFEEDPQRAERFIKTANLPVPAAQDSGGRLAELVGTAQDGSRPQQLVFIDRDRETLFYQVPLFNAITPTEYKRNVVAGMLAASEGAGQ